MIDPADVAFGKSYRDIVGKFLRNEVDHKNFSCLKILRKSPS